MGRRSILDREHHIDLVAFNVAGIVIDGLSLIVACAEAKRSAIEGTL
jgi:hypothetical protein